MSDLTSGGSIRGGQPLQTISAAGPTPVPATAAPQTAQAVPAATGIANLAVQLSENLLKLIQTTPLQGTVGPRIGAAQQGIRLDNGRLLLIPPGLLQEGERVTLLLSAPSVGQPRAYLLERAGLAISPPVEILLLSLSDDLIAEPKVARPPAPPQRAYSDFDVSLNSLPIGPRLLAKVIAPISAPTGQTASSPSPLGPAPLVEGSSLILRLVDDGRDAPSNERPLHPLRGHVLAVQNGKAFVRTSVGDLQVKANELSLRPGLEIVFDIEEIRPPSTTTPASQVRIPLDRLVEELTRTRQLLGPSIDNLIARAVTPRDGAVESLLRVLLARKRGESARVLQVDLPSRLVAAGQTEQSIRLRDAAMELARSEAGAEKEGDWRSQSLPLLLNGEVVPLRIYRRRQQSAAVGESGGRTEIRFVLELALSRFGQTQIDGLLRGNGLDLILRTTRPLRVADREILSGIVARVNETSDVQARIQFKTETVFTVRPAMDMARQRPAAHVNMQS